MPKITIYVPDLVKDRMNAAESWRPNWSAIAQNAFVAECDRLAGQPKLIVPRGSRLSADWVLPEEWRIWAIHSAGLDRARVDSVAASFRDYWTDKTGKDATKLNWFGTWRNWVRKDIEYRAGRQTKVDKRAAVAKAIFGEGRSDVDITGESERLA